MITIKLRAVMGENQMVNSRLEYYGDKSGVKAWKRKVSEEMPEGLDLQNLVMWLDNFLAKNEFWPGAITQSERVWFLPNKRFFLSKTK